jgi:pimeloyl-ACP methyl ester carboxylesterase
MGGLVTMALAARHPELCAGIVVGGACQDLATGSKLLRAGASLLNYRMLSQYVFRWVFVCVGVCVYMCICWTAFFSEACLLIENLSCVF